MDHPAFIDQITDQPSKAWKIDEILDLAAASSAGCVRGWSK
jgi:hypothetical protein